MRKEDIKIKVIARVRYLGGGKAYIQGIPARDLSFEEWERLPEDQRRGALQLGLYEVEVIKDGEK